MGLDGNVTYVVNGTIYDVPEDPQDQDYGEVEGEEFEGAERILRQECVNSGAGDDCDDGY